MMRSGIEQLRHSGHSAKERRKTERGGEKSLGLHRCRAPIGKLACRKETRSQKISTPRSHAVTLRPIPDNSHNRVLPRCIKKLVQTGTKAEEKVAYSQRL